MPGFPFVLSFSLVLIFMCRASATYTLSLSLICFFLFHPNALFSLSPPSPLVLLSSFSFLSRHLPFLARFVVPPPSAPIYRRRSRWQKQHYPIRRFIPPTSRIITQSKSTSIHSIHPRRDDHPPTLRLGDDEAEELERLWDFFLFSHM